MKHLIPFILAACMCLTGCTAVNRSATAHRGLRDVVIELHEQKLFNDLMRMRLCLPTVYIEYGTLQTKITDAVKGGISRNRQALADDGGVSRLLGLSAEGQQQNEIGITASPKMGKDYHLIYNALLGFAAHLQYAPGGEASIPGEVQWWGTISVPKLYNGQHITRSYTFYLPCEFDGKFLELSQSILTNTFAVTTTTSSKATTGSKATKKNETKLIQPKTESSEALETLKRIENLQLFQNSSPLL